MLRIKRLFAVREAKKLIRYSPDVRAAWRRSRRASAALGKTIQEYERAARVVKPKACGVTLRLTPHGPVDILNSIVKWAVKVFCNRSSRVLIAGVEAPPCVAYDVPVLFAMNPTLADMRQMSLVLHVEGYSITVHKNRHGAQGQTYKVSFGEFVTISETLETIAVVNDA